MKILFRILTVVFLSVYANAFAGTETADSIPAEPQPAAQEIKQAVIDSIAGSYADWEEISMSGKLSSPMLPMSASMKIYMVKDELVLISVSAPLVGEVARIEIDPDRVLAVNKWKNVYTTVEMADIETVCPGGLSVIQDMFLGRIYILGQGELTASDASSLQLYDAGNGCWMLLPDQDLASAPFVYYYLIGQDTLNLQRFTILTQDGSGELDCDYTWSQKNLTLDFSSVFGGKSMQASLKLNSPDAAVKPLKRLELDSRYNSTDLKGIFRF